MTSEKDVSLSYRKHSSTHFWRNEQFPQAIFVVVIMVRCTLKSHWRRTKTLAKKSLSAALNESFWKSWLFLKQFLKTQEGILKRLVLNVCANKNIMNIGHIGEKEVGNGHLKILRTHQHLFEKTFFSSHVLSGAN